jgi:geranylgeranyl reductase family protein
VTSLQQVQDVDRVCDVLVVGAGPAGIAAAIGAHRSGHSVIVIDKAVFPRDKCCGDGLTTLALRELESLGLVPEQVSNWMDVDAAWLRSPSGREVRVPLPATGRYAAIAPRIDLDAALVRHARELGVEIAEGHGVETTKDAVRDRGTAIDVAVSGIGIVRARQVIAADGMWSPVRKALNLNEPGYLGEWHAFRQYAHHVDGPAAQRLYVWFEKDLLPGYAWSFPLPGGRVNIGFGVLRSEGQRTKEMGQLWDDLLQRPHIRAALGPQAELEGRHTAWPIPARIDRAVLSAPRVMFVGDAAAATDVLTGEGIGQALLTGRLAGEAISSNDVVHPDAARLAYQRAARHHLVADHKMSAALGWVLRSELGARGALAIIARSGNWGRSNFARWMFEDEPRAVALTPKRWHRGFLSQPGAYANSTSSS